MKGIWKNTITHISFGIVSQGMLFLFTIYVAALLGPLEYGKFSFSLTYTIFFLILIEWGTNVYTVREIGAHPERYHPFFLIGPKWAFAIGGYMLLFFSTFFPQVSPFRSYISILGIGMIGSSFLQYSVAVFQGFGLLRYGSFLLFLQKVFYISSGLILLHFHSSSLFLSLSYTIGMVVSAGVGLLWIRRLKKGGTLVIRTLRDVFKKLVPFVFVRFFSEIYFRVDIIMVQFFLGSKMVGYYSLPYKIIEALMLFTNSFVFSLFPDLSYRAEKGEREFGNTFLKAIRLIAVWGLFVLTVGVLFGKRVFVFVFGTAYTPSIYPFYILLFALFFMQINSLLTHALLSLKEERFYAILILGTAVLNFSLNLWFIPHYKIVGAGITTLISEIFLCSFGGYRIYRWIKRYNGK